jgi:hypothetical protein
MKNEGVREAGQCSKMVRTVAVDVCLLFNVAVIFSLKFPVCKAQIIGDEHENR